MQQYVIFNVLKEYCISKEKERRLVYFSVIETDTASSGPV
jgi:hypothetical protein